ncbi:MAG: phosphoribosylglycinamide formyltransferase [archaeon]|jgi:phosphoribosylglycinamide formyltransferase-1|nr:phosphoribosylglycinamide formyltransferase [archaeon]
MAPPTLLCGRIASPEAPLRCAVLLSGSGSGMEALVRAQRTNGLPHVTTVVISNRADAYGLERAHHLNVHCVVVDQVDDAGQRLSREEHEQRLLAELQAHEIEFIVLAGYMRLLSPVMLEQWGGRIVNIHPSLLPNFPGAHAHRDVLASKTQLSGCTVHMVDEGMDTGTVLAQAPVPVFHDDTESSLSDRVKIEEHRLYPRVLSWIATGRVTLTPNGVLLDGAKPPRVC